jgi:subtilisin
MGVQKRVVDPIVTREIRRKGFASIIVVLEKQTTTGQSGVDFDVSLSLAQKSLDDHFLRELPISRREEKVLAQMAMRHGTGPKPKVAAEVIKKEAARKNTAPPPRYLPRLGVYWGYVDKAGLDNLSGSDQVRVICQSTQLSLIGPSRYDPVNVPESVPWNLAEFRPLWDQGLRGAGVLIGHLDTGVDGKHETFMGKNIRFLEVDSDGDRVETSTNKPYDSGRHGTHTAATICGGPVGGTEIGIAGQAELASAMVIEGGKTDLRTLVGLEWALEQGVQVLNLSMGWPGYDPFLEVVVSRLRDNGLIPVIAVGNEGITRSRSPGNYEEVLSVGAVDRAGAVPVFSGSEVFNRPHRPIKPDIVAPGVGIVSARAGGGLISMDGTSMAAPHVTGLIALLLGVPGATSSLVEQSIRLTAGPVAYFSILRFGNGRISPMAALNELEQLVRFGPNRGAGASPKRKGQNPARTGA